ncbi:MAG: helix-turn-helix transcriptional regulator [Gammaproteobacteria bacterium]|nr:helix-turn-helix transcriptional regulator [Gammaproteobacteria bacterium]
MVNESDIQPLLEAVDLLKALSNAHRLMILCLLVEEKEMSVGKLASFTKLSQSALSQHLAKLRDKDLVQTRKQKQSVFYSLKSDKIRTVVGTLHTIYCGPKSENA